MPSSCVYDDRSKDDLEADRCHLLEEEAEQGTSVQGTSRRFGLISLLVLSMCAAICAAVLFMVQSGTVKMLGHEDTALVQSSMTDGIKYLVQKLQLEVRGAEKANTDMRELVPSAPLHRSNLNSPKPNTTHVLSAPKHDTREKNQSPNSTIWEDPFSMFCFVVVIESEMPLMRWQFKNGAGIFQCTNWRVYSGVREPMHLGKHADGTVAKTTPIPGPEAFFGEAYFWGCKHSTKYLMNANILSRAWENAKAEGLAGLHSWIVKADPDTVLSLAAPDSTQMIDSIWTIVPQNSAKVAVPSVLTALVVVFVELPKFFCQRPTDQGPARLRKPLAMYLLDAASKTAPRYFKNCKTMDSMQGSLEILSRQAFYIYMGKKEQCQRSMDWWHMGEDIFTYKCLQQLGVESSDISEGVMDTYCAQSKSCVERRGRRALRDTGIAAVVEMCVSM
eukprot:symbB.v1.2.013931.t1/scaffold996.1/size145880/12